VTAENWPDSHYALFGTNSNTFIRHVVGETEGITWQEIGGITTPGNRVATRNDISDKRWNGVVWSIRFDEDHPAFKKSTADANPEPPANELPADVYVEINQGWLR